MSFPDIVSVFRLLHNFFSLSEKARNDEKGVFFFHFDLEVPGDFCLLTLAAIISFIFSLSDGFCARTRRGELFSCAVMVYSLEVLDSCAALARSLLGMPRCRRLWLAAREQSATLFARA